MTHVAVAWWRLPYLPARDAGCAYPIARNPDRLLSGSRGDSPPQRSRKRSEDYQAADDALRESVLWPSAGATSNPNIIPLS